MEVVPIQSDFTAAGEECFIIKSGIDEKDDLPGSRG